MDKMKKALMIIAMVCIIAITGSVVYYYVYFKPENTRAELRLQEDKVKQEQVNKEKLKQELDALEKKYKNGIIDAASKNLSPSEFDKLLSFMRDDYERKRENLYKLYE